MKKLWGGRFSTELAKDAKRYSFSLGTDFALFDADIQLNQAWVKALAQVKVLSSKEKTKLLQGLEKIKRKFSKLFDSVQRGRASKEFGDLCLKHEDVHSLIQTELEKNSGAMAKKLRTGRSRNDQVTTALRMTLKKKIKEIEAGMTQFQKVLVGFAAKNQSVIVPGYTHLQKAQAVSVAQVFLSYVEMLERDKGRFQDAAVRMDGLPLGSGALAGASYPISRKTLKKSLGFSKILGNSIDATADRDYVIEVLSAVAQLFIHLSRISEDMILWNSSEFGFLILDDAYATGSSLMPQKKNPDLFELARGRSGRAVGYLNSALINQKGLPLCYNRDLQEDKEAVFPAVSLCLETLEVLCGTLKTAKINKEACQQSVADSLLYATDLLDYFVSKKLSFQDAHELVGQIVKYGLIHGLGLNEIPLSVYKKFNASTDKSVYGIFSSKSSVSRKKTEGSTSPVSVKKQITQWKKKL